MLPASLGRLRANANQVGSFESEGMKGSAKAIMDFKEAIRLYPDTSCTYGKFAWLLATCPEQSVRDGERAIQMATKACELTEWEDCQELAVLAAAYAEAGQFGEAERYQMKALEDPAYHGLAGDGFRQRLELYKQKKPYRDRT
ncbi:MAG: hypothetical protein ACJ8FY_10485 [Gemmataceae bacterium]